MEYVILGLLIIQPSTLYSLNKSRSEERRVG